MAALGEQDSVMLAAIGRFEVSEMPGTAGV